MLKKHLKLLVCPDCRENLNQINVVNQLVGLYCQRCQIIYPIKDDIPILLAKQARNYDLEYLLIKEVENKLSKDPFHKLHRHIKRTLDLLMSKRDILSWEWEDEKFWSRKYAKERITKVSKNWNDRIWEREYLVKELTDRLNLKNKTILSVGCGEGQNFRFLFSKYCDENSLYIATDISFEALKLNRSKNTHKNSLYILCSADYEFPLRNNTVDVLCYFGILHHTKNKSNNIQKDKRLVKNGGYIVVVEPIHRPTLLSELIPKAETSAHESHIRKSKLFAQVEKGSEVVFVRERGTPFFTGMMALFRNAILHNKKLFMFFWNLDTLIMKTLGHIIPLFGAGEIQLLAKPKQL